MAAPHDNSESVHVENGTVERVDVLPAAAVEALVRLRTAFHNDELTERIPAELCMAGFTRVFFSPTHQEDTPRERRDSPAASRPGVRLAVPVYAWRSPVGHLHAVSDPAALDGSATLLRLLAEAVGTIFERNVLADRLRKMDASTREHIREIRLLSEAFTPGYD
ncbi:MAG: hypothetical protein QOD90_3703 [Mycobacterium sp.]|nr:hypothetical protein [Mycobacterium sp.]